VVPARYVAEADEDELSPSSKKFAEDVFTRRASKEIMVDPQAKELYRCYPIIGGNMADLETRLLTLESRKRWRVRWDGFGNKQSTIQSLPTIEHYIDCIRNARHVMVSETRFCPPWSILYHLGRLHMEFSHAPDCLLELFFFLETLISQELTTKGVVIPNLQEVYAFAGEMERLNGMVGKLPLKTTGEEFNDLADAVEALKAWHERYPYKGKPEDEESALALAKAVKGSFFASYPSAKLTGNPFLHAIFLALAGELLGPGADRKEYRALKDALVNVLALKDEVVDYGRPLWWACLAEYIFTDQHLQKLMGHVTKKDVVALMRALRRVQDATLPQYHLQVTRFRSIILSDVASAQDTRLQTISFLVALIVALAQVFVAIWIAD
jgi:hypothetical protein